MKSLFKLIVYISVSSLDLSLYSNTTNFKNTRIRKFSWEKPPLREIPFEGEAAEVTQTSESHQKKAEKVASKDLFKARDRP